MQKYFNNEELKEPSFLEIKLPVTLLIINLFVFQTIFHLSTATLISVASKQNLFSFHGLNEFTFDMWFIVILFAIGAFSFGKLKKQDNCILPLFLVLPIVVVLLSLIRDVSSIIVISLAGVIAFLICRFNYQRLSTKYLEDMANVDNGFK